MSAKNTYFPSSKSACGLPQH